MKVTILGSGVVGVSTAYYLAKAGHEVTVIDRETGPALETSFANAGQISPGYASPWAAPGIPFKAAKWLFMKHAPLIIRPTSDPFQYTWLLSMLANCTSGRYAVNKSRMVRIAEYSRDCLIQLRADTGIEYDHRTQGTLQLFREQSQLDAIGKDVEVLRKDGVPFEVLDREGCAQAEPSLARVKEKYVGGLRLPNDETGDCFKFTNALAKICEGLGVKFQYGVNIKSFLKSGDRVTAVETDQGNITSDRFVVALGSYTRAMVKSLGLNAPIYPVKGYSLTLPIINEDNAPVSTILDESYKIAITRLGDRIRVGGMAELSGFSKDLPANRRATLELSVTDLFPGGGDVKAATYWSGLRPMTPDSTPIIGATRYDNLFINSGHGTLGWTMAAGSGRALADMITGVKPEIDMSDIGISRYG
ncbi:D-amino acid dehydrogenase [Paenochrobactrum sp. BZR 588]|uniref:D-amino acid dehydrogenase n=1 Tax=Paenochrobactrum TaxID=999488 RepID=UPI0035BBEF83